MYITYLKLINHIPFKEDIELFIGDSNFITIKGKTGSGKSYLMNCLHPFSNSSRHFKEYPIYPHKRGYKEIHFEENGNLFKIRHEYIPNNKGSHSCKSYFIKNETELNENGNNDTFKELVKKYLNYTQEVSNFSILSVKSSGFIDSTPASRSSTLFSLVESDTVKVMKENLLSNISDNNARIRLYKETRDEVLQDRNIDEDKETIKIYERSLPEIENEISNLSKSREDLIIQLTKFKESTSKINKNSLKVITDYIKNIENLLKINNIISISDLIFYKGNLNNELNKLELEYNKLENKRKELYNKINNIRSRETLKDKIVSLNRDRINLEIELKRIININKINDFNSIEYIINEIDSNFKDLHSLEVFNIKDSESLEKYILNLKDQIRDLEELYHSIIQAEKLGNIINSEDSVKCPKCGEVHPILLNIYNGLKDKRSSSEIKEKINNLKYKVSKIESLYDSLRRNLLKIKNSDIFNQDFIFENNLENLDVFLSKSLTQSTLELKSKYEHIKSYIINQYKTITQDIKDYENKISIYEIYTDNLDSLINESDNIVSEIDKIKDRIHNHNENKIKLETSIDLKEYITYSIDELISLEDKYKDIFKTIDNYENDIMDKEMLIKNKSALLENTKGKISILKNIVERYNEIYNQLSIYSNKKKDLELIKTILFQDIPKIILNGNIKYMEDAINTILTQNNIDMTITFNTDEKNGISIPVYINSKEVPDARALSSGETSLLSTLINTSLLSLLGYKVLLIDELDAHLDTIYRDIFGKIISSICNILNIDQVFFISHNLNIENSSMVVTVGNVDGLDIDFTNKKIIKIY